MKRLVRAARDYPVGTYSYAAMAGGTRAELTIEESGRTTIIEIMSASGKDLYTHLPDVCGYKCDCEWSDNLYSHACGWRHRTKFYV